MSDYHILDKSSDSRYAEVCVHLPIPSSQNVAGNALSDPTLTYQRATKERLEADDLAAGGDGTIKSKVPDIEAAELTQLQNGEIVEEPVSFRFSSLELTNAQRSSEIEQGNDNMMGIAEMKIDITEPEPSHPHGYLYAKYIAVVDWWGYKRNV
jgi:hypothetical protein